MVDFLKSNINYLFQIIADIGTFIFKPSNYISILSSEENHLFIKRLFFLSLLYVIIITSMPSAITGKIEPNSLSYISMAVLEILLGLSFLPPVLISRFVFERNISLKELCGFLLTAKFTLTIVPLMFDILFRSSENYAFAIAKGVTIYSYIFYLILVIPIIASFSLKRRFFAIIVSFTTIIIWQLLINLLLINGSFSYDEYLKKFNLLYDPIGAECSIAAKCIYRLNNNDIENIVIDLNKKLDYHKNCDSCITISISKKDLSHLYDIWKIKSPNLILELNNNDLLIDSLNRSFLFRTPKSMLALAHKEIVAKRLLFAEINKTLLSGSLINYATLQKELKTTIDCTAETSFMNNRIIHLLVNLQKFNLIVF
jgi:hypothetical protein